MYELKELHDQKLSVGSKVPRTHSGPRASCQLEVTQPKEEFISMQVFHDPDEKQSSNNLLLHKQSSKHHQ